MIQAWRFRPAGGSRFNRESVRIIILAADTFNESTDGASPTGEDGTLAVRCSSGVLANGDILQLPDFRAFRVVAGRGLAPFFHLAEHDCERVRQQVFAVA